MEYDKYITELDNITNSIAKIPQIRGFVHKFFVPGWIGLIQELIVERKMTKEAKKPFYKNLDYYQCGNKIVELTEKACQSIRESDDYNGKENDNTKHLAILSSATSAIEAWGRVYPEIALWNNQKIDDHRTTCLIDVLEKNVRDSLSTIMNIPKERIRRKSNLSFKEEMRAMGNIMAARICNLIVFFLIGLIITVILDNT